MDSIAEDLNGQGNKVERYFCQRVTANNQLDDLVVPFYYDLVYPCGEVPEEGRDFVADALLSRARQAYLPDATVCVRPQTPWFAAVSSRPPDEFATFDCQQLKDPSTCCIVVAGKMTFTQLKPADANLIKGWVAANLNDPILAPGYTVGYLGAELDPNFVSDVVNPTPTEAPADDRGVTSPPPPPFIPANIDQPIAPPSDDGNSQFTVVGILLLIGLILLFVTTTVMIWKRRQRRFFDLDVDAALARSELGLDKDVDSMEDGAGNTHVDMTPTWEDRTLEGADGDPNVEVHAFDGNMQIRSVSSASYQTALGGVHSNNNDMHNSIAREPHLNTGNSHSPRRYRFDLSATPSSPYPPVPGSYYSPSDLFGPTEITVVPPYPIAEDSAANVSESEADSWAQTDGTVGSLEDGEPGHLLDQGMEVGEI